MVAERAERPLTLYLINTNKILNWPMIRKHKYGNQIKYSINNILQCYYCGEMQKQLLECQHKSNV